MTRTKPPSRRPSLNTTVRWTTTDGSQMTFQVTIGYDPQTLQVCEVFYADGQRAGSQLQHLITDTCVLISVAIQNGVSVEVLGRSLGQLPVMGDMQPASVLGVILDVLKAESASLQAGLGVEPDKGCVEDV